MSIFSKIGGQYTNLWQSIVRPHRDTYDVSDLGPKAFAINTRTFMRTDVTLKNGRGQSLACSHFEPIPAERVSPKLPCIIYLHGNCSSRLEALNLLPVFLPLNLTVFCFDFSGSGLSDGKYISLGHFERDDLASVIEYLRESDRISAIGLFGRSMGAVTALLHAHRDQSIGGLVLDSPFCDLRILAEELVDNFVKIKVPGWAVSGALSMVRKSVQTYANFDMFSVRPMDHAPNSHAPAIFAAAHDDTFIYPHHARRLHDAYAGDKNFVVIEGNHNSSRPRCFLDSVGMFFFRTLQCDVFLPKMSKFSFAQDWCENADDEESDDDENDNMPRC